MQNDNSSLGNKIGDSRKKLGLSQDALAEKANVSLSTIQRIEKGTVTPRPFTVKILAESIDGSKQEFDVKWVGISEQMACADVLASSQ